MVGLLGAWRGAGGGSRDEGCGAGDVVAGLTGREAGFGGGTGCLE